MTAKLDAPRYRAAGLSRPLRRGKNTVADMQHQIRTTYTQKARSYDVWVRGMTLGIETRLRRRLIRRLALHPGDRVLDIACGTGLNFPIIQEAIGSTGSLTGVDLTSAMLAEAGKRVAAYG
jgi:demethylmenaquinone methyltransferase/2-methoxy-6-polyprenyl-1,4-benzoquinol methylase